MKITIKGGNTRSIALANFGIGGLLALIGGIWLVSTMSFVGEAATATGVVRSASAFKTANRGYPVEIEFTDADGDEYTWTHYVQSHPTAARSAYREGASVPVLFHPRRPVATARDGRFFVLWKWPAILLAAAAVAFVVGVASWVAAGKAATGKVHGRPAPRRSGRARPMRYAGDRGEHSRTRR